jgi:shikimate dehydrogenase
MSGKSLYGVVGNPIKHSISPRIHQLWYEKADIDAVYVPLEVKTDSAVEDLATLARVGFSGLNITLPYKTDALKASLRQSDAAVKIGAANTLTLNDSTSEIREWTAHNTDFTGFLWSLDRLKLPHTGRVLLIGSGGAARAVAYALALRGMKLTIVNRTTSNAEAMCEDLGLTNAEIAPFDGDISLAEDFDLVVNTISLGHQGGHIEMPETKSGVFIDISYGKAADNTLQKARTAGWVTEDGLPMLIGQAADAFKIWFGIEPDREAALQAMRSLQR